MAKATKAPKASKEKMSADAVFLDSVKSTTIQLSDIVSNTAQSRGTGVLPRLQSIGWNLFEKSSPDKPALWGLLFSEDTEDVKKFCSLIEEFEPEIVKLAEGIKKNGMLQPIGVRRVDGDEMDVIYGMRRTVACGYLQAKYNFGTGIEAKVFEGELNQVQLWFIALEENDNREDENPIDRAILYQRLQKIGKMSPAQIGARLSPPRSDQYIRQYVNLLDPLLDDKRTDIRDRIMSVDRATKLLIQRKGSGNGAGGEQEVSANGERHRLPGTKGLIKILAAKKKPRKVDEEWWNWYTNPTVREFLCFAVGVPFEEFEEETEKRDPIRVGRAKAIKLLTELGKEMAETWSDEMLKQKLENIPNVMSDENQRPESDLMCQLLDKLLEEYPLGLEVEIIAPKEKAETEEEAPAKKKKGKKVKS